MKSYIMTSQIFCFNFFCLETKETKVQDLDLYAKNKSCSLKILNLREVTIS